MTSNIQGYNTDFSSIAEYRLYLDLSETDKEFRTNARIPTFYTEEMSEVPKYGNVSDYIPKKTMYEYIQENTNLKPFLKFIDYYGLGKHLQTHDQFTFFVPVKGLEEVINSISMNFLSAKDIVQYHSIKYPILPVQLIKRKYRIETEFGGQYININNMIIVKEDDSTYSNRILQSIKTDNGLLYIIEKPLIPYVY